MSGEDHYMQNSNGATPGQGYNQYIEEKPKQLLIPTPKETALIADLDDNLEQTEEFIENFEKDQSTLSDTYSDCQKLIQEKFANLHQLLKDCEDKHMEELTKRFMAPDDLLQNQLESLKNHKHNNEDTRNDCLNHIATMPISNKNEKKERLEIIRNSIDKCINESPNIQKVPILLEFLFPTDRDLKKSISNYGKINFREIRTGSHLPYSRLNTDVITKKSGINNKNNYNNNKDEIKSDSNRFSEQNGNIDNENNELKEESELETNINDLSIDDFPEKIKFRCNIICKNNEIKENKLISLTKSRNEMNYDGFLAKIRNVAKDNDSQFSICTKNNQNVSNDNELIKHILSKAATFDKEQIKTNVLGIEATAN